LDVSGFNTSKVTNMGGMFNGCSKLEILNLSGWVVNITDTSSSVALVLSSVTSLRKITLPKTISADLAIPTSYSWYNTSNGNSVVPTTISSYDENSTYSNAVIKVISSETKAYFPTGWKTTVHSKAGVSYSEITSISFVSELPDTTTWTYYGYVDNDNLIAIYESDTNIQFYSPITIYGVDGSNSYFSGCSVLTTVIFTNFNTSEMTTFGSMFYDCSSLIELDLSSFDTSNITNMDTMFFYCSSLTSLDLSNFDTSNVTTMVSMFAECTSLETLNLFGWTVNSGTNLSLSSVRFLKTVTLPKTISINLFIPSLYTWYNTSNGNAVVPTIISSYAENSTYSNAVIRVGYTVTLSASGASCTELNGWSDGSGKYTKVVLYGDALGSMPTVTKTGYKFSEWNESSDGTGNIYTEESVITSDTTIYAVWKSVCALTITSNYSSTADSFAMAFANITGNGNTWNLMLVSGEEFKLTNLAEGTYTIVVSSTINHKATVQNGTITLGGSTTTSTVVVEVTKVSAGGFYGATAVSSTASSSLNAENNVQSTVSSSMNAENNVQSIVESSLNTENNVQSIEIPQLIEAETYQNSEETCEVLTTNVENEQEMACEVQTLNVENEQAKTSETNVDYEITSTKEMQIANQSKEVLENKKTFSTLDLSSYQYCKKWL
jgi:surface protein